MLNIKPWLIILTALWIVPVARAAGHADGVKSALSSAREHLLALLDAADAASQDKQKAEIAKASKVVDQELTAALAEKPTPEQSGQYKAFKETWEAFKKTRDTEIVPAIKAGKKDDAKALAKGIQAERFKKMQELLAALGAK